MHKRRSLAPSILPAVEHLEDRQMLSATSLELMMQSMRSSDFDAMVQAVAQAQEEQEEQADMVSLNFSALGEGRQYREVEMPTEQFGTVKIFTHNHEGLTVEKGAVSAGTNGEDALTVHFETPQKIMGVRVDHRKGKKGGAVELVADGKVHSFAMKKDGIVDTKGLQALSITLRVPAKGRYALESILLADPVTEEPKTEDVVVQLPIYDSPQPPIEESSPVVETEPEEPVQAPVLQPIPPVVEPQPIYDSPQPPAAEEEAPIAPTEEAVDREALNRDIAAAVLAGLQEEAERIGDAKMEIITVQRGQGYTDIMVRFRSAHAATYLELFVDKGYGSRQVERITLTHDGGTQEMSHPFRIRAGDNQPGGIFTLSMYDQAGGSLLQRTFGRYVPHNNSLSIYTPSDWNDDTEEDPSLAPALNVRTEGSVAFLRYRVPSAGAYAQIVNPGLYGKEWDAVSITAEDSIGNDGGTTNGFLQLALPVGLKTDKALELRLWDKQWGRLFTTVPLWWDGTTLSVVDGGEETWEGMRPEEETLAQSLSVSTGQIADIQKQVLYERSIFFVSRGEMEQRVRERHADLFIGEQAYVEQQRMKNPGYSDGFYMNQYRNLTNDMLLNYNRGLDEYVETMMALIKSGMQWWVKAKWGTYDSEWYAGLLQELNARSFPMAGIIDRPSMDAFMKECKRLLNENDKYLEKVQVDDDQYREGAEYRDRDRVYGTYDAPPSPSVAGTPYLGHTLV